MRIILKAVLVCVALITVSMRVGSYHVEEKSHKGLADSVLFRTAVEFVRHEGLHHPTDRYTVRIDPRALSEDHPRFYVNNESLSPFAAEPAVQRARIITELEIDTTNIVFDLAVCGSTGGLDAIDFAAIDSLGVGTLKAVPNRCRSRLASIAFSRIEHERPCTNIRKKPRQGDEMYVAFSTLDEVTSCASVYAIEVTDNSFFAYRLYLIQDELTDWLVARKSFVDGAKS